MDIYLIVGSLAVIVVGVGAVIVILLRQKPSGSDEKMGALLERLELLRQQNNELRLEMDRKLSETHKTNQEQFGQNTKIVQNITAQSAKLIEEVTERLIKLDETNRQVVNFSAQLQNLQDILKNPKQRGVLGEYFLEETLKNVLPPKSYQTQYPFKDGTIVDAVVFVKDKVIPIDAKFSLENYERLISCTDQSTRQKLETQFKQDLKNRIDETAKYVKPEENTLEFAFMFIPSEAIYYDLLVNSVGTVKVNTRDLIEYAFRDKKVIIVSPTSFLAYLQTVLQGLKAMQIEEQAKEIIGRIDKLQRHIGSYDEFMKKLGVSMSTAVNHYNNAYTEFKKIDKDVTKITAKESDIEVIKIERPKSI